MFDTNSKPYAAWRKTGEAIEKDVREGKIDVKNGKGLVCVSAHWENEDGDGVLSECSTSVAYAVLQMVLIILRMFMLCYISQYRSIEPFSIRL